MKTSKLKKRIRRLQEQLRIALDPPRHSIRTPGVEVLVDGRPMPDVRTVCVEPGIVEELDCASLEDDFKTKLMAKRMPPRILITTDYGP